ncbi:MAG: hypothetical protein AAFV53_15005 [Myxococcota bacterium]
MTDLTFDPTQLALPEEGKTIVVNANHIRERVVVPRQRIVWYLQGWERGNIMLADRQSILIFDLDKRQLHTISLHETDKPLYVMHLITNLFTEEGTVGADITFSPYLAVQPVSEVPGERWLEVLMLARIHGPTHQRLLALRD